MIQIDNISRSWAEFQLRNIDLKIRDQEYFSILGPTGAGKTLLLEAIMGLSRPDKGRIMMDGKNITFTPPEKRDMGMVFQDIHLFPHMNVAKNIAYSLLGFGRTSKKIRERVSEVADLLGISKLLHRRPCTLSRGEQQRVAIGRAIVNRPRVLLLDEPLSALDRPTSRRIMSFIKDLHRKEKMTVVHVSHDQEEVMRISDRIAVMNNGQIEDTGTWKEIFRTPKSEFIARLVGVENLMEGRAEKTAWGAQISVNGYTFESDSKCRGYVIMGLRADDVHISKKGPTNRREQNNYVKGRVSGLFEQGTNVEVEVTCGDHNGDVGTLKDPPVFRVHISRQIYSTLSLTLGDNIDIWFPRASVQIFQS